MTADYAHSLEAQILGRVFTYQGILHFVLDANPRTGMARCSRRVQEAPAMTWLPVAKIHQILSAGRDPGSDETALVSGENLWAEDRITH